eukprot:c9469_g1_i1 orf=490-2625(+)
MLSWISPRLQGAEQPYDTQRRSRNYCASGSYVPIGCVDPDEGDGILSETLEALCTLIFEDSSDAMESVSRDVRITALRSLKILWQRFHHEHLKVGKDGASYLAKLIVWLAMEQEAYMKHFDTVNKFDHFILDRVQMSFEHFINEHWELSPCLVGTRVDVCGMLAGVTGKEVGMDSISDLLKVLLTRAFSCPAFNSDELDTWKIFNDIMGKLGHGLILGEDIRIIKSVPFEGNFPGRMREQEIIYRHCNEVSSAATCTRDAPWLLDVQACIDAYELGYTVALRGMEFRSHEIATMTNALAICFGQATVGANLYLTPPNAQGLTLHYDDHCVLVCQLVGQKHWKLYPAEYVLPRLYSQNHISENFYHQNKPARVMLLEEGDVLYIPRGYPHEANTKNLFCQEEQGEVEGVALSLKDKSGDQLALKNIEDVRCCNDGELKSTSLMCQCSCMNQWAECNHKLNKDRQYSLHITFGIEVEPPFEWEGFVHMALHHWSEQQQWEAMFLESKYTILSVLTIDKFVELCMGLVHIAIRDCGDTCSAFRKACLIAAKPAWGRTCQILDWENDIVVEALGPLDRDAACENNLCFEQTFESLISYVDSHADFRAAYGTAYSTLDHEKVCLDWMRWLGHLSSTNLEPGTCSLWNEPAALFSDVLKHGFLEPFVEEIYNGFTEMKSRFVNECEFLETCKVFESLLNRYKATRKQYVSGILALHC